MSASGKLTRGQKRDAREIADWIAIRDGKLTDHFIFSDGTQMYCPALASCQFAATKAVEEILNKYTPYIQRKIEKRAKYLSDLLYYTDIE